MNTKQVLLPISASNGYNRRKSEMDVPDRFENKFQADKKNSGRIGSSILLESPRDRLIYMTSHLMGQQVEIQLVDGSVYAGIFHSIDAKDYGIVLKMAHLIKDTSRGPKFFQDFSRKTLIKTFIVPYGDLVQVTAKGVSVIWEGQVHEPLLGKQQDIMTDSYISQSWHIDAGRELEPWVPDESDPFPELENTFDCPWNRGWDQFEANKTLFGVKSTFDEELYTTKLEKGPQMLELERVAERLAREIEGEDTRDLHLAEERGLQINGNLDIDEETLYSSVYRSVDDSGGDEIEDIILNSKNQETFRDHEEVRRDYVDDKHMLFGNSAQIVDGTQAPPRSSPPGEAKSFRNELDEACHLGSESNVQQKLSEMPPKQSHVVNTSSDHVDQFLERPRNISSKDGKQKYLVDDQCAVSKADEFDPLNTSTIGQEKASPCNESLESSAPSRTRGTASPLARPSSSASSASDRAGPASTSTGRGLSSSSSVTSISSEKSTLNPHAKEFKLNPNAKSFMPSRAPLRSSSPIGDSPFYYSPNMAATAQIHGMPVGMGMGPSFAIPQPLMYSSQAGTLPQPYYSPQYGQQMMIGQQRPVFLMSPYPSEMPPYKGRDS